jgi:hypothetical protein
VVQYCRPERVYFLPPFLYGYIIFFDSVLLFQSLEELMEMAYKYYDDTALPKLVNCFSCGNLKPVF